MTKIRIAVSVEEHSETDPAQSYSYEGSVAIETAARPEDVGAAIAELVENYLERKSDGRQ